MLRKLLVGMLTFVSFSLVAALPPHERFNVRLSTVKKGTQCTYLKGLKLDLSYRYDFEKNMGAAWLHEIGDTPMSVVLHPLGLSSMYAFMSDMSPVSVKIGARHIMVYRIIFDLYKDGSKAAAVMFGQKGDCILATANFGGLTT